MSDPRATSGQAPEAPASNAGQATRTSPERQPGREQDAGRQEPAGKEKPGKVNLYEIPEFKNYQASVQQTIEKERQKAAELEKRLRQVEDASLSDYDKAVKEAERARAELEAVKQEREQERQWLAFQQEVIAQKQKLNKRFGIPIEELDQATSYDEAEEMAVAYFKAQTTKAPEAEDPAARRRAANKPNLGTGSREVTRNVEELRRAWEGGDSAGYVEELLKARSK